VYSAGSTDTAAENQMSDAITQGNTAMEQMTSASAPLEKLGGAVDHVDAMVVTASSTVDIWKPFIEKIELFTKIADQIAEV
jgi:hypothetical protein